MKVKVNVECTPEEARRFLGLPDVTSANEIYVDNLSNVIKGATNVEQLQALAGQFAPLGQMGLKLFQDLMTSGATAAMGSGKKTKE